MSKIQNSILKGRMAMNLTFQHVIDHLLQGSEPAAQTVDRLLFGRPDTELAGIATAFSASQHVIEQALALNANLIITHEGVFYSHHNTRYGVENDPVYAEKTELIEKSRLGIFRLHDHIHHVRPDAIMTGLLQALEWQAHVIDEQPTAAIIQLPAITVGEIADYVKQKLQLSYVRVAGSPSTVCRRVGVLVGYRGGGELAIPLFHQENLDLIIAGEGPEWETPEYVQDAIQQGRNKALIMLGHAESEAAGMRHLADILSAEFPTLPVHFLSSRPVFQIM
jgi:putative NIF3 family GTP cyclohydrolase 1 type 2